MLSLLIILASIVSVVIISRLITFAVLKWKVLPKNTLSNGKRVHHFVYGNVLIVFTSFLVIGLGVDGAAWWIALLYGIGLGLVLDEFPHWIGNVKELTRNVAIIPGAIPAALLACGVIIVCMVLKAIDIL